LTAPHAGKPISKIPGVPIRTGKGVKKFSIRWDSNTNEIIRIVEKEIEKYINRKPYVVMAKFSRKYADANRDPTSAFESYQAMPFYFRYQNAVQDFVNEVKTKWGKGILIDIHGQSKRPSVIWRGTLNGKSLTYFINCNGWDTIYGSKGLLGILKQKGYTIYPSEPYGKEAPYNGGYTIAKYGSHTDNGIDAIQLEIGSNFRSNNTVLTKFSKDLAKAIIIFYQEIIQSIECKHENKKSDFVSYQREHYLKSTLSITKIQSNGAN
jgi:N-formylglutamate amidohydrolase